MPAIRVVTGPATRAPSTSIRRVSLRAGQRSPALFPPSVECLSALSSAHSNGMRTINGTKDHCAARSAVIPRITVPVSETQKESRMLARYRFEYALTPLFRHGQIACRVSTCSATNSSISTTLLRSVHLEQRCRSWRNYEFVDRWW